MAFLSLALHRFPFFLIVAQQFIHLLIALAPLSQFIFISKFKVFFFSLTSLHLYLCYISFWFLLTLSSFLYFPSSHPLSAPSWWSLSSLLFILSILHYFSSFLHLINSEDSLIDFFVSTQPLFLLYCPSIFPFFSRLQPSINKNILGHDTKTCIPKYMLSTCWWTAGKPSTHARAHTHKHVEYATYSICYDPCCSTIRMIQ